MINAVTDKKHANLLHSKVDVFAELNARSPIPLIFFPQGKVWVGEEGEGWGLGIGGVKLQEVPVGV
jgi:hypothetical protein